MNIKTLIASSPLPNFESEILLAFLLKKDRTFIITYLDKNISSRNYSDFKKLEKKRLSGYSIAHILSEKEFFSLKFKINKHTLAPRPLTELMVEEALAKAISIPQDLIIVDIGTGSGAIIISLAKELRRLNPPLFKKIKFLAIDISRPALRIAQENLKKHRLSTKIKLFYGDLGNPLKKIDLRNNNLIITANLPYLTPKQSNTLPSIQKEPKIALEGGFDGLRLYDKLFKQLSNLECKHLTCICEFNSKQSAKISNLAKKYFKSGKFKLKKDLSKQTRFLVIEK